MSELLISEAQAKYPGSGVFTFGDSSELCDRLLSLVRSGKKTATCEALQTFQSGSESLPEVGRVDVVLDWDGIPELAVRTVQILRFCDVDEEFALSEGENDNLKGWQTDHRDYIERNIGFNNKMELVCERFELVEIFEYNLSSHEGNAAKSKHIGIRNDCYECAIIHAQINISSYRLVICLLFGFCRQSVRKIGAV